MRTTGVPKVPQSRSTRPSWSPGAPTLLPGHGTEARPGPSTPGPPHRRLPGSPAYGRALQKVVRWPGNKWAAQQKGLDDGCPQTLPNERWGPSQHSPSDASQIIPANRYISTPGIVWMGKSQKSFINLSDHFLCMSTAWPSSLSCSRRTRPPELT